MKTPEEWALEVGICQKTEKSLDGEWHLVPDHRKQEAEFARVLRLALAEALLERDKVMQLAVRLERDACARVALAHDGSIGEDCWNHENTSEARLTCSQQIARDIRARGKS